MSMMVVARRVASPIRHWLRPMWPSEGEAWDRKAGTATEQNAELDGLTIDGDAGAAGHPYVPTPPRLARVWLDRVVAEGRTFVDMGSGRGRVVLMASERPFRRVVGVEFTAELHEAALANLSRFPARRRRCSEVEFRHLDAARFAVPSGPLVVYFDNPFSGEIMDRVLDNLQASWEEQPRPMVLVYQQLKDEGADTTTDNIGLLDRRGFVQGRTLEYPWRDRPFLSPFVVRIYTTPEAPENERGSG